MGLGNNAGCFYLKINKSLQVDKGTIAAIGTLGAMYLDAKYAIRNDLHMIHSARTVLK